MVVMRLRANARTWRAAARTDDDAPPAARALLAGRTRVELPAREARDVIAWARTIPGWDSDGGGALESYPLSGGARSPPKRATSTLRPRVRSVLNAT